MADKFFGKNSTSKTRKAGVKKLINVIGEMVIRETPNHASAENMASHFGAVILQAALRDKQLREDLLIG